MIRKIMKGIIFVFAFSVCVLFVNAAECVPPVNDNSTDDNRVLQCDKTAQKTTHFAYGPTNVDINTLCKASCKEDLLLLIDSAKNVRAGMGFSFPLYISGQKTCTISYDYSKYDSDLRTLVANRNKQTKGSAAYNTLVNQIKNKLLEKTECDNWSSGYSMNASASLEVSTSEAVQTIPYKFVPTTGVQTTSNPDTASYKSCNLGGNPEANCTDTDTTTSSITQNLSIDGRYTMADRYIEKYTGNVVTTYVEGKTCNAKDIYFTSFYEYTRPVSTNPSDNGYPLKLTVTNLGNNIIAGGNKWKLTVNCWYALKNLIFPQKGTTSATDDVYYTLFGNTAFMYRQINLSTPFPNRAPGENWQGKESLITSTKGDMPNKTLYEIKLTPETIKEIKFYNSTHDYDNFDFKNGKSTFIEANPDIIKRK
jgi:hypothetical protein